MSPSRAWLLGALVLCATATRAAASPPSPWRLEAQTAHHFSAGGESARLLNGGGLALSWRFASRWELVGSVVLEGSRDSSAIFVALPVGAALRRTLVTTSCTRFYARAGLALAREWVTQFSAAGVYANEDFATTRLDAGLGVARAMGPVEVGVELRLVSLSRWADFGDAPDHPLGLGLVPAQALGAELALIVGRAVR